MVRRIGDVIGTGRLGHALAALLACGLCVPAAALDGPRGITAPTAFPPFAASDEPCARPEGLKPTLAFAQDNQREFMVGVDHGLARAAADRAIPYQAVLADNDPARQAEQLRSLREAGIGSVVV